MVISTQSFPRLSGAKPILLIGALFLAGCGGKTGESGQIVTGNGFRFAAPAGWTVTQKPRTATAASGSVDRLQVQVFRLLRPYRSQLFAATARELDRVARQVGGQLRGRVTSRATVPVAGRDARSYSISYRGLVEEITFVLDGQREYELLCRRAANAPDENCRRLVTSFRLGGASSR